LVGTNQRGLVLGTSFVQSIGTCMTINAAIEGVLKVLRKYTVSWKEQAQVSIGHIICSVHRHMHDHQCMTVL
jgi:metal-responsive CopG/Arc/MetJ family transcriptional regulator